MQVLVLTVMCVCVTLSGSGTCTWACNGPGRPALVPALQPFVACMLKTEAAKRRRIQLKRERVLDSQRRKEWSKAHGRDTYGCNDEADTVQKVGVKRKCKCGSTAHSPPTHRDCPMNKKRKIDVPVSLHDNIAPCDSSDSDRD